MNKGIPISEFAAQSPENAAIVEKLKTGLDSGEISMCGCMGPMYGEPHCYCTMKQKGMPLNEAARAIEKERTQKQLDALFGPGGAFDWPSN